MSDADDETHCACRDWVEEQLATLRAEVAAEVRTSRLVVSSGGREVVRIEAGADVAFVEVRHATGSVELVAWSDASDNYAGVSLTAGGDVVAALSATRGPSPTCHLVFDQPNGNGPWTIIDRGGVRQEG